MFSADYLWLNHHSLTARCGRKAKAGTAKPWPSDDADPDDVCQDCIEHTA